MKATGGGCVWQHRLHCFLSLTQVRKLLQCWPTLLRSLSSWVACGVGQIEQDGVDLFTTNGSHGVLSKTVLGGISGVACLHLIMRKSKRKIWKFYASTRVSCLTEQQACSFPVALQICPACETGMALLYLWLSKASGVVGSNETTWATRTYLLPHW